MIGITDHYIIWPTGEGHWRYFDELQECLQSLGIIDFKIIVHNYTFIPTADYKFERSQDNLTLVSFRKNYHNYFKNLEKCETGALEHLQEILKLSDKHSYTCICYFTSEEHKNLVKLANILK